MATLVLSTVGTILGGPVGGAIGGLLGQSIDQQVFGPGPREGPRLGDLSVQTSSYGTPIARLFGTMRVAGSIVWSTDLQEDAQTQGAKGQPDAITYSYSASFAVALSSRNITDIRRIWADGKLIRTAEGEFTVSTVFRFYDGSEDQPIDPLIATIEGIDGAPAYRGIALAVFEHLQLAEFGNRIPFLTFEVIADAAAVPLAGMLADVSGGAIDCSIPGTLQGYAAYGSTIAAAVEPVVEMLGIDLSDNGSVLKSPTSDLVEPSEEELGCGAGPDPKPRTERSQLSARSLPAALSLSYYDPAREYQTGLARASIEAVAAGGDTIDLAAVMEAPAAKAVAETVLARRWAERDKLTLRLPPGYLSLRPGSRVRAAGESRPWKAERVTIDSLAVLVELRPIYSTIDSVPADPGRVLPSAGVVPTPTTVAIVELPDDGSGASDSPVVVVAASTSGANWRTVPLLVEIGGSSLTLKTASARAVMGVAENALGGGPSTLFDLLNTVDVELANGDDWLESRTYDALIDGANLALVGSELIQFGDALPLGSNRFRLSRLLRGRRGSEWAMGIHQPGDRFVIVDAARLAQLHLNSAHAGARIGITPQGPADTAGGMVELAVIGEAMRPPSPVHLRASIAPDGALRCAWVRRSRRGWSWLDGVDAPLDSAVELYRVTVQGAAGSLERESGSRSIDFTAADLAVLAGSEVQIRVAQIGELAVSRPTVLSLTIN